jgi:hypothetical protein
MAVGSILVRPFDWGGFTVVGANIAHDFSVQIFDRGEDAAGNQITLDFREPDFNLVEPWGVGRRVMNAHFRMTGQKIGDCFGFVCAQVVANDVNGLLRSLAGDQIFQKSNELRTGVASSTSPRSRNTGNVVPRPRTDTREPSDRMELGTCVSANATVTKTQILLKMSSIENDLHGVNAEIAKGQRGESVGVCAL